MSKFGIDSGNIIGTGSWRFHSAKYAGSTEGRHGSNPAWEDPDASADELVAALVPWRQDEPGVFLWSEWRKVGRKMMKVETGKRIEVGGAK